MNGDYSEVEKALKKKAIGYDTEEIVEEFSSVEGELTLSKRKVTTKNYPPDVTALKMLMETEKETSNMTDEELEAEKIRLLNLLKEINKKGETNCKEQKTLKPKTKSLRKKS